VEILAWSSDVAHRSAVWVSGEHQTRLEVVVCPPFSSQFILLSFKETTKKLTICCVLFLPDPEEPWLMLRWKKPSRE